MEDKSEFSGFSESDIDKPHLGREVSESLRALLQRRLEECGWRDKMRKMIREILEERGANQISYEDIAVEVIPKARAMVPDNVRRELQMRVRAHVKSQFDERKAAEKLKKPIRTRTRTHTSPK